MYTPFELTSFREIIKLLSNQLSYLDSRWKRDTVYVANHREKDTSYFGSGRALCATYFIIRRAMIQTEWSRRILRKSGGERAAAAAAAIGKRGRRGERRAKPRASKSIVFSSLAVKRREDEKEGERRGMREFRVKRLVASFRFPLRNAISSRLFNTDRGNRSALPGKRGERRESENCGKLRPNYPRETDISPRFRTFRVAIY